MLENSDQQQTALSIGEESVLVTHVRDSIVRRHPEWRDDRALFDKLANAYREAKRMGLSQDQSLADFLYLEIEAPGFYRHPAISKWLEQPGASIENRFEDLLDVLRNNLKRDWEDR